MRIVMAEITDTIIKVFTFVNLIELVLLRIVFCLKPVLQEFRKSVIALGFSFVLGWKEINTRFFILKIC